MFNPFLKGQVSFKCGGGLIFTFFYFSKHLCIIFNLRMRLGPRACLCFFALLHRRCTHWGRVSGTLMGTVSPISTSQRDTRHREATNWKEVSSLRHPQEQGTQSCFCLGQAHKERSHQKQLVFPTGKHL